MQTITTKKDWKTFRAWAEVEEKCNDWESYFCNQINKHNSHELSEKWQERKIKFHPQISSCNLYTIVFGRLSVNNKKYVSLLPRSKSLNLSHKHFSLRCRRSSLQWHALKLHSGYIVSLIHHNVTLDPPKSLFSFQSFTFLLLLKSLSYFHVSSQFHVFLFVRFWIKHDRFRCSDWCGIVSDVIMCVLVCLE